MKMRFFAKEGVSSEFLINVGKTYEYMFEEGVNIRADAGTEEIEAVMKTGDTVAAEILAESFKEESNPEIENKEKKDVPKDS